MTGLRFSPDMKMMFFSERAGQNTVDYAVNLAEPAQRYTLARYRADDVYANPGTLVGTRGGGGGGGAAAAAAVAAAAVAASGRCSSRPTARASSSRARSTTRIPTRSVRRPSSTRSRSRPARSSGSTRATTTTRSSACHRRSTSTRGRFIVAREGPNEVPQQYLVQNGTRTQLTKNQDYTPDVTNARRRALHDRAARRVQVQRTVTLPQDYQKGHAAAGDLLVLPARVPGSGRVRPARSDVQQELVPGLRHALDGVPRPPRLRGRRARLADRRPGRADEQQLRARPAQQPRGGHRRARQARAGRPDAAGDRRPQLRRVLDGQRDGPHAVLQGRHRRRRRLQPHADAARLPERAPRPLGSAERLPRRCRRSSTRTT